MPMTCSDHHALVPLLGGPVVLACVCGFLADLEDQRIRLTVDPTGRLWAEPRGVLDHDQRAFIRAHRDHVVAVVDYLARVDAGAPC
jgi:hypothetical protein